MEQKGGWAGLGVGEGGEEGVDGGGEEEAVDLEVVGRGLETIHEPHGGAHGPDLWGGGR